MSLQIILLTSIKTRIYRKATDGHIGDKRCVFNRFYPFFERGSGTKFAEDEYANDINKNEHTNYIKANGTVMNDGTITALNYTLNSKFATAPQGIKLKGGLGTGDTRLVILKSSDSNPGEISGELEVLFESRSGSVNLR
jgi:hypothetical protein